MNLCVKVTFSLALPSSLLKFPITSSTNWRHYQLNCRVIAIHPDKNPSVMHPDKNPSVVLWLNVTKRDGDCPLKAYDAFDYDTENMGLQAV